MRSAEVQADPAGSAWLIHQFIDSDATIGFVTDPADGLTGDGCV